MQGAAPPVVNPVLAPEASAAPAASAPVSAWIGLGANLGDRLATLRTALSAVGALPGTRVRRARTASMTMPPFAPILTGTAR